MEKLQKNLVTGLILLFSLGQSVQVYADPAQPPVLTKVEKKFLRDSGRQVAYPHEYVAVLETRDQYDLGKLAALRFIEWVKDHPNGVVALTTGGTSEYFIKYLYYYKKNWQTSKVQAELKNLGINLKKFPDTTNLKLVQIEEYFPISSKHYKNVMNTTQRHYVKILGLKKQNVLLMDLTNRGILAEKGMNVVFMNGKIDLSIMKKKPSSQLETWQQKAITELQQFCREYERKISEWGGIDFFVGSMGYGGQLGFNMAKTKANSPTHIEQLDYMNAAHCAKDLGGIEYAKHKAVVTIGLGTITMKKDAVFILVATGESKANSVRDSVERKYDINYPCTTLQKFPNSRLYVTRGSAKLLSDRKTEDIMLATKSGWNTHQIAEVIIEIAQAKRKQITSLTKEDIAGFERGRLLLQHPPKSIEEMLQDVRNNLINKFEAGQKLVDAKGLKILHTGPHHDDIMLGYYPLMDNFIRKHKNHVVYLTSGFNSVADAQILKALNCVSDAWINQEQDTLFKTSYEKNINKFRTYFAKRDSAKIDYLDTILVLKHLAHIYDIKNSDQLKHTIRWLKDEYFPNKNAGDLDIPSIKMLKGMMRESEADKLWALKNLPLDKVTHLRSGFYSGREFGKTPSFNVDVLPFLNLYNDLAPDMITLADDPQSAPPKTHFAVLQVIADALRAKDAVKNDKLEILGYRNVWFKYTVNEANVFVPVSARMQESQQIAFADCFHTQFEPMFPSPFFDGEFSQIAVNTQAEQLAVLKLLLGADYFARHPNPEMRDATGVIFFNKMSLNKFFMRATDLQHARELEDSFYS